MDKTDASSMINIVCSLIFAVFTFLYLLFFQDDMLFYAQHVLSEGVTVYNPLVGAVIITSLAMLLSLLSSRLFTRNLSSIPALHHLPSALFLAALTDIHIVEYGNSQVFGNVWIASIVLFIILLVINRFAKELPVNAKVISTARMMSSMARNLFVVLCMITLMFALGNTDEIDHLRLRGEMLLKKERFDDAAEVGKVQNVGNEQFTMMRAYALGKTGELGERFFEYPVVGNANSLLPSKSNRLLVLPAYEIYKFIGGVPSPGMDARECISILAKQNKLSGDAHDYKYIASLIDRDLDGFVSCLKGDSATMDSLPKHYREALTLYKHLRTAPAINYQSPAMDADFRDFQDMIKKNPDRILRENALRDSYAKTYWFYYYFRPETK